MLNGIYTPDIETVAIDTEVTGDPTVVIRTPFFSGGLEGPACLIVGDVTSDNGVGTLLVESGTWDAAVGGTGGFEADAANANVCYVSTTEGLSATQSILKVTNGKYYPDTQKVGAFRITVTGLESTAHVRVQGKTVDVTNE